MHWPAGAEYQRVWPCADAANREMQIKKRRPKIARIAAQARWNDSEDRDETT